MFKNKVFAELEAIIVLLHNSKTSRNEGSSFEAKQVRMDETK